MHYCWWKKSYNSWDVVIPFMLFIYKGFLNHQQYQVILYTSPKINILNTEIMMVWFRWFSEFPGGVYQPKPWVLPCLAVSLGSSGTLAAMQSWWPSCHRADPECLGGGLEATYPGWPRGWGTRYPHRTYGWVQKYPSHKTNIGMGIPPCFIGKYHEKWWDLFNHPGENEHVSPQKGTILKGNEPYEPAIIFRGHVKFRKILVG